MNHKDRALFHAYKDFENACSRNLGLQENVIRDAKILYRKFNTEKLTRGAVRTGIKANCVLYACKINKVSLTTKEVADAFGVPTKDVSRTQAIFKEHISKEVKQKSNSVVCTTPTDVIYRLLNEFDISDKRMWRVKCIKLAETIQDCVELMGKTPSRVGSVIIYKVLGDMFSKSVICEKCKVSIPTLNKIEGIINRHLEDKNKK